MDRNFHELSLTLRPDHQWKATSGFRIAALDRGAILFEFPQDWICIPDRESVKFYDRRPPSDSCRLSVSQPDLPASAHYLPLHELVTRVVKSDARGLNRTLPVVCVCKQSIELAWMEVQFTDLQGAHEARSRLCFARGAGVHALLTFEFWQEDTPQFIPTWHHVLDTLVLGEIILDPASGARIQRNNPKTG